MAIKSLIQKAGEDMYIGTGFNSEYTKKFFLAVSAAIINTLLEAKISGMESGLVGVPSPTAQIGPPITIGSAATFKNVLDINFKAKQITGKMIPQFLNGLNLLVSTLSLAQVQFYAKATPAGAFVVTPGGFLFDSRKCLDNLKKECKDKGLVDHNKKLTNEMVRMLEAIKTSFSTLMGTAFTTVPIITGVPAVPAVAFPPTLATGSII